MNQPWRYSLLGALALCLAGCSSSEDNTTDDGVPDGAVDEDGNPIAAPGFQVGPDGELCMSNRDFLATEAWTQVINTSCVSCHGPGGVAEQQNAELALFPAAYPGFLEANLDNITQVAKNSNEGISVMLRKPLGELNHGGGAILQEDSEAFQTLSELVDRVSASEEACPEQPLVSSFADVELLDPVASFRKASLQLTGRLPSASEIDSLLDSGEEALPDLVMALMNEEAFYDRLVEIFNDQWLTDRYLRDSQNVLDDDDFPAADGYYEALPDDQREAARRSIAREPLELMAYIVRQERPFTEILTADYTVLNAYTAPVYNNEMSFSGDYSERELQEGRIAIIRDGQRIDFPHAGILSSPMFLNRYPTSRTNRNRHRARIVLREFLATDILKIADRPIDPTKSVNFANPTREDPDCQTCHAVLDPIAGAFQKWDDNDQEQYLPDREWHQEMFLPGFGEEQMQVTDYPDSLQWLGQRVAADPRFPLSVVRNVYKSLLGQEPLAFPDDPKDGSYPAWEAQDGTIRAISEAFVSDNYNLKTVIREIVLSPYYRAANTTATSESRLGQLAAVGTGRLLTPELLHRKILATVGVPWRVNNRDALLNDYRVLFGGIDSDSVVERLTVPNGIMSAIAWRMANEVSCRAVSFDFSKDGDDRWLFPRVDVDVLPEDELGQPDSEAEEEIKQNIRHMVALIHGDSLAMDDPEVTRIYDLFANTWREGRAQLAAEEVSRSLPGECQFRRDPFNNADIPEADRLVRDDTYAIRSWMAVTTYLLSDYRFLYE